MAYMYLLTPAGLTAKTELSARFLKIKMAEYEALRNEIAQLRRDSREGPSHTHGG
ncbi:hypothetical protein ANT2_2760 [plant metagenome]|uniref:Transcriptional regulator, MarR family n=1 Tax=plant metagenome TaxID=1297885 RepID=A0A484SH76_9ZZZZ